MMVKLRTNRKMFELLNQSIPILIGIFIFIIPFPHKTAVQEICFYLSFFLVLTLALCKKIEFSFKSPLTLPLILFTLWTIVSLPAALNKENSFHDIYAHLLKYIAIYYLITNLYNNKKRFVILSWILIVSVTLFSIGGIIYFYNIQGVGFGRRLGLPEVGIGVNYIGFFTITAIFFSLANLFRKVNLQFKVTSIACLSVSLAATILTGTRGTILGLFLPLILLLFHRYKKKGAVVTIILLVIVGLTPVKHFFTPNAIMNRIKEEPRKVIWHIYWKVIKDHPITGIGYGMQTYNKKLLDGYYLNIFHAPHNTFIDVTVRLGIVGLALFLYLVFIFIRLGWQLAQYGSDDFIKTWALFLQAAFVSFLIQGMFADMLLGVQIIIFFILMAMMTVLWRINEDHPGCFLTLFRTHYNDSRN